MKEQIKPELNNESKARFFAQYLFQNVLKWGDIPEPIRLIDPDMVTQSEPSSHLVLTRHSDLTDNIITDAIKIGCFEKGCTADFHPSEDGLLWTITFPDGRKHVEPVPHFVIDFLRLESIAVGYIGHSVEDLVNAGWVKLKGVNTNG